jgi:hypothetical protein
MRLVSPLFALVLAVCLLVPTSGSVNARSIASKIRRDELVVRVYSFAGVTWGHVDVFYDNGGKLTPFHTCARRRCYFYPIHHALMLLRETPRKSKHWKFRAWIVRNGGKTTHIHSTSFRLRVIGHLHENTIWYRARVKANYVYP